MIFVTRYSFITAILLSNLFFLFFIGLSRSNRVLLRIPLRVFAVLGAALLVKLLFPIEVESTVEISSFRIYPAIIAFLEKKLFTIGSFTVQVRWLLLAVWMTGMVCIAWSRVRFYRQLVRRFGHLPSNCDERFLEILEEVKQENGYSFETTVIVDKNIRTILEYGYFRQIIFMPKAAYSEGELRYIFLHELEHFANKTNWMKLIIMLLECIFWWNPLVYLFRDACAHLLEVYCDSCVSRKLNKQEKVDYLGCLLQEMKREHAVCCRDPFGSQFFRQAHLKQRFAVMMQYERDRKIEKCIYFMIFALLFLSYSIVLQPEYRPPEVDLSIIHDADYVIVPEDGGYMYYLDDEPFIFFRSIEEIEMMGLHYDAQNDEK